MTVADLYCTRCVRHHEVLFRAIECGDHYNRWSLGGAKIDHGATHESKSEGSLYCARCVLKLAAEDED